MQTICITTGWRDPVADLVNLGLLDDVLRRVNSSAATDRAVYVIGHSRGAALVGILRSLHSAFMQSFHGGSYGFHQSWVVP